MNVELKCEIISRLKQKFDEFCIDFDKFCNLLIDNNAFLSGSFLLQVIQNKFFDKEEYDIDIYTFGEQNIVLEENICKLINDAVSKKISKLKGKFMISDTVSEVMMINKYNDIDKYVNGESRIISEYSYDNIRSVIDFESKKNIMRKYQLVYCRNNVYKTPKDVVDKTDFSFCSNYFDGNDIYIKDYNSIISLCCVLDVNRTRIYKNENKRIVKYINRGYNIGLKYNDNIYKILYINNNSNDKNIFISLADDVKYLALIYPKKYAMSDDLLTMLPRELEKLIIYTHCCENIIDNLPSTVQELKLYIWQGGTGTQSLGNDADTKENILAKNRKQWHTDHQETVNKACENVKKIPFSCKIYVNDELVN